MSTVRREYNGWSNRETWNVQLWITNQESIYKLIRRIAKGCKSTSELADNIEGFLLILWEDKTPDGDSLGPVNWSEIADVWADELYLNKYWKREDAN